ncbi:MAG TPA: type II toxin-antitoxin system death-on-curing family toxin [Candidatus Angelobacter sp.]|nr:type II toxin-antitoxin system death-on-curing family toxin [Candidatus Angelobacter sp.]
MNEPIWINKRALLQAHSLALIEHGGLEGIRDEGLLDSALARPKNLYAYEGVQDIQRLAVSYAVGILRNHPFFDGNKRAAFIALNIILNLNGLRLKVDPLEAAGIFLAVAAGKVNEESLVAWVLMHTISRTEN